uniref:SGNH_hydro domain-containing protein n=1 Tax=Steinernema glaseri TaxID=37863 RepID=A0A1I7YVK1_9BILA
MTVSAAPPAIFMYLFGLFNSWSQLTMMLVDLSVGSNLITLEIEYTRPAPGPTDSLEAFKAAYNLVFLNVCSSVPDGLKDQEIRYDWTMKLEGSTLYDQQLPSTPNCSISWKAPVQANYIVTVTGYVANGTEKALMGQNKITVVDRWIAAIGDSYASGEGNPSINCAANKPAKWMSEICHRSNRSWPHKVFSLFEHRFQNAAVHFTYVPCTGASVDNGILTGKDQSQLELIGNITAFRRSGPDVLLMSLGGNDVGYSEILSHLINSANEERSNYLFGGLDLRFFYVSHQIDRVVEKLKQIRPKMVVLPHYFDITENEVGHIDSDCEDLRKVPRQNLRQARLLILNRLNEILALKGFQNQWVILSSEIRSIFAKKGICSRNSLIRSIASSNHIQCNPFGGFHPTEEAHTQIAEAIWNRIGPQIFD